MKKSIDNKQQEVYYNQWIRHKRLHNIYLCYILFVFIIKKVPLGTNVIKINDYFFFIFALRQARGTQRLP